MSDKGIYSLVKDEIKVALINRTDEDQVIDLFALPSGINPSQGIGYGDLFTTQFCEVLIPLTDFGSAKSWTINWFDQDDVAQTTTFTSTTISDFILNLNSASKENFGYSVEGAFFKIVKRPFDTFVYFSAWQAPVGVDFGTPSAITVPFALGSLNGVRLMEALNSTNYFGSGQATENGYFTLSNSGYFSFYRYSNPTSPFSTIDTNAAWGLSNPSSVAYDSYNQNALIADVDLPNGSFAWIELDAFATPNTILNPTGTQCRGAVFYWDAAQTTIGMNTGVSISSEVVSYDKDRNLIIQTQPLNVAGTTNISFSQTRESFSQDESGNAWIGNSSQIATGAEAGVFKFENGDISQATDEILYDTINGMPASTYKPVVQYIKGRIFVAGIVGAGSYVDVYDVQTKQLISSSLYSGRSIRSLSYAEVYGDYILWSDTSASNEVLVTDFDGQAVQIESFGSGNGYYIKYLQGSGDNSFVRFSSNLTGSQIATAVSQSSSSENKGAKEEEYYTKNKFVDVENNTDAVTYDFVCNTVIKGTGISVVDVRGGLTYEELVQGLRNNATPYLFETISIGTQSLQQANMPITKVNRGASGHTSKLIDNPVISPMQRQFKIQDYPINFLPKTISKLLYKVKANQGAVITIEYSKGNLNAIIETIDAYITHDIPLNVSLKQLVEDITEEQKDYIKEKLIAIAKRRGLEQDIKDFKIKLDSVFIDKDSIESDLEKLKESQVEVIDSIRKSEEEFIQSKRSKRNIKSIVRNYISRSN